MKIYISVISHQHANLIEDLDCISKLSQEFEVVLKINKAEDVSYFNNLSRIHVLNENYGLGFGENNNYVFNYCKKNLEMTNNDFFLVLNPDVDIDPKMIISLTEKMKLINCKISTINLYTDYDFLQYDNSVRFFPTLFDFFSSFLIGENKTIVDKNTINTPKYVDWSSGAFLMFLTSHYESLGGFDEKYFMYCEDIDICLRSGIKGNQLMYFPEIKAIHKIGGLNNNIFSKHFYWHVRSIMRYLRSKYGLTRPKTSIKNKLNF